MSFIQEQRTVAQNRIANNTNGSHISSFFDITYFDFDSAELSADTRKVLDKAVDKFFTNPSGRVVISGHADERGTREYNPALEHTQSVGCC